jgi:hypothetical protein
MTILDQLDQLEQNKQRLLTQAEAELREQYAQLKATFERYGLSWPDDANRSGDVKRRRVNLARPCPVCHARFEPKHDKRAHTRNHPEPFTDKEIAERGWRRLD